MLVQTFYAELRSHGSVLKRIRICGFRAPDIRTGSIKRNKWLFVTQPDVHALNRCPHEPVKDSGSAILPPTGSAI